MLNITVSLIAILLCFTLSCVFWEDVKKKLRESLCYLQLKKKISNSIPTGAAVIIHI